MRATRQIRKWDRLKAEFVAITVECSLDEKMRCGECRYYDSNTGQCNGVGSLFYLKQVQSPVYIPKPHECSVRLPPSLLTYY
jgi:hypothetical protein